MWTRSLMIPHNKDQSSLITNQILKNCNDFLRKVFGQFPVFCHFRSSEGYFESFFLCKANPVSEIAWKLAWRKLEHLNPILLFSFDCFLSRPKHSKSQISRFTGGLWPQGSRIWTRKVSSMND